MELFAALHQATVESVPDASAFDDLVARLVQLCRSRAQNNIVTITQIGQVTRFDRLPRDFPKKWIADLRIAISNALGRNGFQVCHQRSPINSPGYASPTSPSECTVSPSLPSGVHSSAPSVTSSSFHSLQDAGKLPSWIAYAQDILQRQKHTQPSAQNVVDAVLETAANTGVPCNWEVRLCAYVAMRYGLESRSDWLEIIAETRRKRMWAKPPLPSPSTSLPQSVLAPSVVPKTLRVPVSAQSVPSDTSPPKIEDRAPPTPSDLIRVPSEPLSPEEIDVATKVVQTLWPIFGREALTLRGVKYRISFYLRKALFSTNDTTLRGKSIHSATLDCIRLLCALCDRAILDQQYHPLPPLHSTPHTILWQQVSSLATATSKPSSGPSSIHHVPLKDADDGESGDKKDDLFDLANADDTHWEKMGIDPAMSAKARPGSEEKVQTLAARYATGESLWHERDADHGIPEEEVLAQQALVARRKNQNNSVPAEVSTAGLTGMSAVDVDGDDREEWPEDSDMFPQKDAPDTIRRRYRLCRERHKDLKTRRINQ